MAINKITFEDKEDLETPSFPSKNILSASNINEMKNVVNNVIDQFNVFDLSNYYNKTQIDSKFAQKSNISNLQGQINNLNNKQLKKLTINISATGIKDNYSNNGMRFTVRNYDLWTNHKVGYTQIVGVSFCNKSGSTKFLMSYCVYENSWIELQFFNTYSASEFSQNGHVYIWYV